MCGGADRSGFRETTYITAHCGKIPSDILSLHRVEEYLGLFWVVHLGLENCEARFQLNDSFLNSLSVGVLCNHFSSI
jgi:hypothetical protein